MGRLMMQAKVQGMNEYNASEGATEALNAEMALADAIRNDASTNDSYWNAGYEKVIGSARASLRLSAQRQLSGRDLPAVLLLQQAGHSIMAANLTRRVLTVFHTTITQRCCMKAKECKPLLRHAALMATVSLL